MTKLIIAATALLAGTAALAQTAPNAQPAPAQTAPPAPMPHPMADKAMTRADAVAKVREHFGEMDTNKDGAISQAEIDQGRAKFAGKFKDFDGGRHGMAMGDPNAAFDRLDANKDGSISRDEFAKAHEQRIERRIEIRDKRDQAREDAKDGAKDGREARHAMRMHHGGGYGDRMIVMADTNKDGKITQAEAEALALQHFDQMDTNKDGTVTPEERRAARPMIIKKVIEEKKVAS